MPKRRTCSETTHKKSLVLTLLRRCEGECYLELYNPGIERFFDMFTANISFWTDDSFIWDDDINGTTDIEVAEEQLTLCVRRTLKDKFGRDGVEIIIPNEIVKRIETEPAYAEKWACHTMTERKDFLNWDDIPW